MELPDKTAPTEQPKKKLAPVVSGAVLSKRPATRRLKDFLLAESPKALAGKIGRDVVVPRVKAGLEEAINSFLAGMLWGDSANRPIGGNVGRTVLRGGATNYNAISSGPPSALTQARQANISRPSGTYEDVICPSQQHAEVLLANMFDLMNRYNVVAVGDLYEMAGITPSPSDNAYGWYSLDGARISKVREGWALELPRPSLI